MLVSEITPSRLANTKGAFLALIESDADWIVRSADDLHMLRRDARESGLARLSDGAFEDFVASCKFAKGGIAGGNTGILTKELGLRMTLSVFHHFGVTTELALSWQEQECRSSGCGFDFWSFCSEINCHPQVAGPNE